MRRRIVAAALIAATLLGASALAHEYEVGMIRIEHPWARATPGKAPNGAAYMTLVNLGTKADRLLRVASPVARRVSLHTHLTENGIMKMRPVKAIEVVPGSPTVLQPGGLHVMLMGLKAPLKVGETFSLTLTFERAGTVQVQVVVQSPGAMKPGHGGGGKPPSS